MRGRNREELKKVKHVIQYAVFAAYHLSLETSFLADEGATLPKMAQGRSIAKQEMAIVDPAISVIPDSIASTNCEAVAERSANDQEIMDINPELERCETLSVNFGLENGFPLSADAVDVVVENAVPDVCNDDLESNIEVTLPQDGRQSEEISELTKSEKINKNEVSSEYFSAADTHQSILVSFSSHCVLKGTVCERSRLMRIKFYGCFDKPLGRYLRDDLFGQVIRFLLPYALFCDAWSQVSNINLTIFIARHQTVGLARNQLKPMSCAIPISREI